jgi:hypothetical protein
VDVDAVVAILLRVLLMVDESWSYWTVNDFEFFLLFYSWQ